MTVSLVKRPKVSLVKPAQPATRATVTTEHTFGRRLPYGVTVTRIRTIES